MALPRGRIFTLSHYQPRPTFPVAVHRGDQVDVTINWVRLLRTRETPNEVINAASVSGRGVTVTNVEFSGKYLSFTLSGAQSTGIARVSMAISTNRGRTLSRSMLVRTVYEDAVIDAVLSPPPPPPPPPDPSSLEFVATGFVTSGYTYGAGVNEDGYTQILGSLNWAPPPANHGISLDVHMEYGGTLGSALVFMRYDEFDELEQSSLISIAYAFSDTVSAGGSFTANDAIGFGVLPALPTWKYWAFGMDVPAYLLAGESFTITAVVEAG
jgi:hypothetical protein